ncbi:serine carboxypeptidase [Collybia nuda]|uniref:Carboxypeptidase n=1 Tax=Collybia nuda TaxID=64659 RepID=A0A9P5Y5A2_9AGAR|nr:serine carboxypeptidase [Collybia nuda]
MRLIPGRLLCTILLPFWVVLGLSDSAQEYPFQVYLESTPTEPLSRFVKTNGIVYEEFSHGAFEGYRLRIRKPSLCDPSVLQYSGYLDIAEDKHIFFWFFESRSSPKEDPLVLWLNGGPGCSSTTGLLFELGPCTIEPNGTSTHRNPHSWNSNANIFFLDQPIDVGYSHGDKGANPINNTPAAAADVFTFLQLFMRRFTKYSQLPFHIAAESYGGLYAPHIASIIHKANKQLIYAPSSKIKRINLESILLGNGLTDPLIQMPSIVNYACDGPFAVLDPNGRECRGMRQRAPVCERLIRSCYKNDNQVTCAPATLYCWQGLFGSLQSTGRNIYDVRKMCNPKDDGDLCYKELSWIEAYMNQPDIMAELGAHPEQHYKSCNTVINLKFMFKGDGMRNSRALLPELVNEGIRLLVYAGNTDMMCNYMGEEQWISHLETIFLPEFSRTPASPWITHDSGITAGVVRSAGGRGTGAGNVTFVTVYEAGHMVPHDQPEAALDMLNRWIQNVPLTSSLV